MDKNNSTTGLNDNISDLALKLEETRSFAKIILVAVENNFDSAEQEDLENTLYLLVERISDVINDYNELSEKLGF